MAEPYGQPAADKWPRTPWAQDWWQLALVHMPPGPARAAPTTQRVWPLAGSHGPRHRPGWTWPLRGDTETAHSHVQTTPGHDPTSGTPRGGLSRPESPLGWISPWGVSPPTAAHTLWAELILIASQPGSQSHPRAIRAQPRQQGPTHTQGTRLGHTHGRSGRWHRTPAATCSHLARTGTPGRSP